MQDTPEVKTSESGDVAVNGSLTLTTVAGLLARHPGVDAGTSRDPVTVDLGAVSHVDSAGLALLVEWDSAARRNGKTLRFTAAPVALQSLARVAGLGERFA